MNEVYHTTKWLKFIIREKKPKTVAIEVLNTSDFHLGYTGSPPGGNTCSIRHSTPPRCSTTAACRGWSTC